MSRVEAHEVIAHGMKCDSTSCDVLIPTRNAQSHPEGFYVRLERVTELATKNKRVSSELFFCSKDCLLSAMQWQLSSLTDVSQPLGLPTFAVLP